MLSRPCTWFVTTSFFDAIPDLESPLFKDANQDLHNIPWTTRSLMQMNYSDSLSFLFSSHFNIPLFCFTSMAFGNLVYLWLFTCWTTKFSLSFNDRLQWLLHCRRKPWVQIIRDEYPRMIRTMGGCRLPWTLGKEYHVCKYNWRGVVTSCMFLYFT